MIKMRMLSNEELGLHLKTMRKSRGLTQKDLGDAIGQSAGSIGMYETGKRRPDHETLEAIADVFNVGIQALIFTEPTISDIDEYLDAIPKTQESRIISGGIDRMPKERREQALRILQVAFAEFADYFKEENDDADT